jgi:hypothetical protein
MQPPSSSPQDRLRQHVQASLRRAEMYTSNLRKTYTRLVIGGLISSAATTLVAGGAVLQGITIGLGIGGWASSCFVAAVLGFVSTICVGVVQQLKLGERLPLGQICVGRLRALDLELTTGTREWPEIAKEYEAVIKESAEVFS